MKSSLISLLLIFFWLFPDSIEAKKPNVFVLCTWNIGHFSNGSKHYSLIRIDDFQEQLGLYRSFVYKDLCPDVIVLNEYNRVFCGVDEDSNDYVTSSLLFDNFKNSVIGTQINFICNAVFSNVKMKKPRFVFFESQKSTEGDDEIKSKENYFIETDLYIHGKIVKLVCLHLLFSLKVEELYQRKQMEELINRYEKTDRVIMCGDWNTGIYSSLKDAGYILANNSSLKTFPSKGYPLDNIVVKGLSISEVKMIKTNLSDHYPLICKIILND